jgi:hypothetical protein
MDVESPVLILLSILYFMTYVNMVKCIRISVIDIGVKSPKAGIAHPSGVPKFILGFSGVSETITF